MSPSPIAPISSAPRTAAATRPAFGEILRGAASARAVPSRPERTERTARAALESLDRARARLDAALAAARRGRTFTASELLTLQADAYRFSETVELASKVVEGGAQAVRQLVNSQV
jgi:hypothetical protein